MMTVSANDGRRRPQTLCQIPILGTRVQEHHADHQLEEREQSHDLECHRQRTPPPVAILERERRRENEHQHSEAVGVLARLDGERWYQVDRSNGGIAQVPQEQHELVMAKK